MSDTPVPAAEIGLPENLYPSRGFARIPQTMTLQQEYELQLGIAQRACGRMRVIETLITIEKAEAFEGESGGAAVPPTMFPHTIASVVRMPDGTLAITTPHSGCGEEGGPNDAA